MRLWGRPPAAGARSARGLLGVDPGPAPRHLAEACARVHGVTDYLVFAVGDHIDLVGLVGRPVPPVVAEMLVVWETPARPGPRHRARRRRRRGGRRRARAPSSPSGARRGLASGGDGWRRAGGGRGSSSQYVQVALVYVGDLAGALCAGRRCRGARPAARGAHRPLAAPRPRERARPRAHAGRDDDVNVRHVCAEFAGGLSVSLSDDSLDEPRTGAGLRADRRRARSRDRATSAVVAEAVAAATAALVDDAVSSVAAEALASAAATAAAPRRRLRAALPHAVELVGQTASDAATSLVVTVPDAARSPAPRRGARPPQTRYRQVTGSHVVVLTGT